MDKIRLTRTGKRGQPHYRIVVVDSRSKRDGHYVEALGYYNPLTHPLTVKLDKSRYQYWLTHGAQPTLTVRALAKKA